MDPQRMERNSHLYEEILSELQQQNSLRSSQKANHLVSNRKDYARLDIESMGVDLKENFRLVLNFLIIKWKFNLFCIFVEHLKKKVY